MSVSSLARMLSIAELTTRLKERKQSAVEVVQHHLKAVEQTKLNTFVTVTSATALAQAQRLDERLKRGDQVGKLAGVPLAIKDVIITRGVESTAGSQALRGYLPPYSATVVDRLEAEDAIILGKTNCDEFAMGSSGENSSYGATKNPWDTTRVPGGSSSGSAAAVAAGECLAALGTDTGGSIRQPAAFCGVVGLKPSYGRVSRYGLMAMTSSFDQAGPLTHTVEDAAYLLQAMAGADEKDATCQRVAVPDYLAELQKSVAGLRIGLPKEFFAEGLSAEVGAAIQAAVAKLEAAGARVSEVSLPNMAYAMAAYYVICPSEVSANLARYDGIKYGSRQAGDTLYDVYAKTRGKLLGAEVKRRIMLGTYVLSSGYYDAYYRTALAARVSIKFDFAQAFKQVDVLATPTTPTVAFALGSKTEDPLHMYLADIYTVPVNIAGLPAVSVPCGFSDGLPIGLQLIGKSFDEATLLRAAYAYEQVTDWHKQTVVSHKP